jgi:hypothetical protein
MARGTRSLPTLLCGLLIAGCASHNDGDVLEPAKSDLDGSWEYLVTNAYDARFSGCTGDASVLEGQTLYEGLALAPICLAAVTFEVSQAGALFELTPHEVTCSDGASATVGGSGEIHDPTIGGQWESTSSQGVAAVQEFTGTIVGQTIQLSEFRRTFSGAFAGACDLSPALTAVVTVQ